MFRPADELLGLELPGGWKVLERLKKMPDQTGGLFSVGYLVVDDNGNKAFLKALDYHRAMQSPDPARVLEGLTRSYNFERDLLTRCRRMDRVVKGLADGSVNVSDEKAGSYVVQYLILEFADGGDVRKYLEVSKRFNTAWVLRCLHNIATGLRQLHSDGVAHQDLKPSNVLVFDETVSKVGDLGSACSRGVIAPREDEPVAGDREYAPPELCYKYIPPDWGARRLGCDAYLLGGMMVFFFGQSNMTAMIIERLDPTLRPKIWRGTYAEVLPYVREAFELSLTTLGEDLQNRSPHLKEELVQIVRELCDPDPKYRGHPLERRSEASQFSLERYVARFDLLARREELRILSP
jgi:serine/threonine protein kinase